MSGIHQKSPLDYRGSALSPGSLKKLVNVAVMFSIRFYPCRRHWEKGKNDSKHQRRAAPITEILSNLQRCEVSSEIQGHKRVLCSTGEITSELQLPEFKAFKAFPNTLTSQIGQLPSSEMEVLGKILRLMFNFEYILVFFPFSSFFFNFICFLFFRGMKGELLPLPIFNRFNKCLFLEWVLGYFSIGALYSNLT